MQDSNWDSLSLDPLKDKVISFLKGKGHVVHNNEVFIQIVNRINWGEPDDLLVSFRTDRGLITLSVNLRLQQSEPFSLAYDDIES